MRMWRYARTFRAEGHDIRVITDVGRLAMDTHVEVDGETVWESHPSKPIVLPGSAAKMMAGQSGLAMAGLNWLVEELGTKDQWLFYTIFADTPVAFAGFLRALRFAQTRAQPA
ncbi:MAG: hypothetical protein ACK5SX_02590 [Sandaracinobacter sp.]